MGFSHSGGADLGRPDPERPEIILTVRGVGYKAGTA